MKGSPYARFFARILLGISLFSPLALAVHSAAFSQAEIATVAITRADVSEFPLVHLNLSARDPSGLPVQVLPAASLRVFEDNVNLPILSSEPADVGVRVAFVIDVGEGVRNTGETLAAVYALAQPYLQGFLIGRPWMIAGLDEITVIVQEGPTTRVVVPMTTDPTVASEALLAYTTPHDRDFDESPEYGEWTAAGLKAGLDELEFAPGIPGKTRALVLITPGMRADLSELAERSIGLGTPIHVFIARKETSTYWTDALRPLALVTGGDYMASYDNDNFEPLFGKLAAQRLQHIVTYRSILPNPGARQVALEIVSGSQTFGAASQYSVPIQPPEVAILSPGPGTEISRKAEQGETPADAEPTFISVVAQVGWPDSLPREVRLAQLLVDKVSVGQGTVTDGQTEITWDLRSYQEKGKVPAGLQVQVEDELGLKGLSPAVNVSVEYIPPGPSFSPPQSFLLYGSVAIAVVALGLAIFLFINRSRVGPMVQHAGDSIQDFVERVTGRRTALVAKAYLIPLDGFETPPMKPFEIYGTTAIGRSRRNADLLFHVHDEDSPISRLHCTILDEDDHFAMRDEDSTNGTLVNGEKLTPLEPHVLHDGDTVEVAPLERGGLKFLFQLASTDGSIPDAQSEMRITKPRRLFRRGGTED